MTERMHALVRRVSQLAGATGPVIEIGSYREAQQEHLDMRLAFPPGTPFRGIDRVPGPGVDCVADVRYLGDVNAALRDFPTPNTILCLYVLEHEWNIRDAALKVGALWRQSPSAWLWIATHQNQPYHGTDNYPDYWRITASGLARLMDDVQIPDARIFVSPDSSNPEDVLAIRQPEGSAWPEHVFATALGELKSAGLVWEQYR